MCAEKIRLGVSVRPSPEMLRGGSWISHVQHKSWRTRKDIKIYQNMSKWVWVWHAPRGSLRSGVPHVPLLQGTGMDPPTRPQKILQGPSRNFQNRCSKLHKAHLIQKGPHHTRRPDPLTAQPCPRHVHNTAKECPRSGNISTVWPWQVLWNSIFSIVWYINWDSESIQVPKNGNRTTKQSRREGTNQRRERTREKGNRSMSIADGEHECWDMQKNRRIQQETWKKQKENIKKRLSRGKRGLETDMKR